jgi:trimethylamine--corrinoid protein Co-methyltransferase
MKMLFEPFTSAELQKLDSATIRVFEKTGIRVLEPEAAGLLADAGASYDKKTSIARIPERVVRDCLKSAPRKFKLYSRDERKSLAFGEGKVHFGTVGTAVQVEGLDGVVRPATLKDAEDFFKLTDALPYIDHTGWACWPRDTPDFLAPLQEIFFGFKHSTKTLDGWNWGRIGAEQSLDLASFVVGGREELIERPLLLGFANPVSPLTLSKEATEGLIAYARNGQPCLYPPECMAGGTAPATIAGLLVQQNAEILSSVMVAQLVRRGAPAIYSSVSSIMDMRTGSIALGAPEACLVMAGSAQLARFYGLPSRGTGGNTESMLADYQAGVEAANTLLIAALSGFDFIYDAAGSIESSLTASFTKAVLDNDLCGEVKRILMGIDVSEETMATDVIDSVALKGAYLSHPHTLKHFRKEHFAPSLLWRGARTAWAAQTKKDLRERAVERCRELLRNHRTDPPLEADIEKKMLQYIKDVGKRGKP